MAAYVSFLVGKGEAATFFGTHQKTEKDSSPKDITGYTILVTAKHPDGTVAFAVPGAVLVGNAGTYSWSVTSVQTNIAHDTLDIDIWRTDAGNEELMALGKFVIGQNVKYGS